MNIITTILKPTIKKSLPLVFTVMMLLTFSFNGLAQSKNETPAKTNNPELMKEAPMLPNWGYTLIKTAPNQWGFSITKDHVVIISNKVIPGLESTIWYAEERIAIQVAEYIVRKIEKEGYPLIAPITQLELINAGIILNPKN